MEIPRGTVYDNSGSLNARESGAMQTLGNAERDWNATQQAARGAANEWGSIREETDRKAAHMRAARNEAKTRVLFAEASTTLAEETAGREIEDEDLATFESNIRQGLDSLDLTDEEYELADLAVQEYSAKAREGAVGYNLRIRQANTEADVHNSVNALNDLGQFDDALDTLEANKSLYTPTQYEETLHGIISTREHNEVIDRIGSGTEAETKAAQQYADSLLVGEAVPASMRDTLHASLTQLVNRVDSRRKEMETESKEAAKEAYTDHLNTLKMQARFGVEEEDGSVTYLDRDAVESMYKAETIDAEARYTLTSLINTREAAKLQVDSDIEEMLGAVMRGDSTAALGNPRANSAATLYVQKNMPEIGKYHTQEWAPADRATLFALVSNSYMPAQVSGLLNSAPSVVSPESTAAGLALWRDMKARVPMAANDLAEGTRNYFNTIDAMEASGVPIGDAVGMVREQRERRPEKAVLDRQYKATGADLATNSEALLDQFSTDEELNYLTPPTGDFFGGDPTVRTAVAEQYDALVRHYYMTSENVEAARKTAYQTIRQTLRPSRFNGGLELMVAPPEVPRGANAPVDSTILREEFDEWAKSQGVTVEEGEQLLVFPVIGSFAAANGEQLYYVTKRAAGAEPTSRGDRVNDANGMPKLWYPDFQDYETRRKAKAEASIGPVDEEARAREARVRGGKAAQERARRAIERDAPYLKPEGL